MSPSPKKKKQANAHVRIYLRYEILHLLTAHHVGSRCVVDLRVSAAARRRGRGIGGEADEGARLFAKKNT